MATTTTTHRLQVGDILHSSWGYDQTNATFYEVVALNGKTQVTVSQIGKRLSDDGSGAVPAPDAPYRYPEWHEKAGERQMLRRTVKHGDTVRINSYSYASKWGGRPMHDSRLLGYPGH